MDRIDTGAIRYRTTEYMKGNWLLLIVGFVLSFTAATILVDLITRGISVLGWQSIISSLNISHFLLLPILFILLVLSDYLVQNYRVFVLRVTDQAMVDENSIEINQLFKSGIQLKLLQLVIVKIALIALWSLLLIIPGILKAYQYSQTTNLLFEKPEASMSDILEQSKQLMSKNIFAYIKIQLIYNWIYIVPVFLFVMFILNNLGNIQIAEEMGNDFISLVYGMLTGAVAMIILFMFIVALYVEPKKNASKQVFYRELEIARGED